MNKSQNGFRVWNGKEYLLSNCFTTYTLDTTGNLIQLDLVKNNLYKAITPDKKLTIEKCSGLRSKNRKLIYEGDILESIMTKHLFIVECKDGIFYAKMLPSEQRVFVSTINRISNVCGTIHTGKIKEGICLKKRSKKHK